MKRGRGGVRLGTAAQVCLLVGLPALVTLDVGRLGYARLTAADHATNAALAASAQWQHSPDVVAAYRAAVGTLPSDGEAVEPSSFSVSPNGTVSLTLSRTMHPLLLSRLGTPRSWAHLRQSVSSRALP